MDGYSAPGAKKCAAVPPIMIHSGTPCPPMASTSSHGACILPPISPQSSVLSSGHHSPTKRPLCEDRLPVKQENFVQTTSCMFNHPQGPSVSRTLPSNIHLLPNQRPPNQISPLASSGAGTQQLQCGYNQSPLLFDLSPSHHASKLHGKTHHFEPRKGPKIKTEFQAGIHKLPPLSGIASGSNLDIDDTFSPLVPPINSISPYIGSGISEIPSFPSILASPAMNSTRKRALSTSPLSDMFDVYAFRSSPNSLMALYNNANASSNNSAVGHLIGQSNPPIAAMQYRVQQRMTSIEHNQNNDGTTNTTITNQVTFSENPHSKEQVNSKLQTGSGSKPIEMDQNSIFTHENGEEDPLDPHVCLWEGCGVNFNDLEDLVQHIENAHIEKGKAEEYVCLWQSCIRNRKPFNARYKLLIHMRIHSGEKPNKCTVSLTIRQSIHIAGSSH